jgi:Protein of unknown function (DUF1592)/Protein of unknown function (DUF1588)/Protein of unknown function (DUF1585)
MRNFQSCLTIAAFTAACSGGADGPASAPIPAAPPAAHAPVIVTAAMDPHAQVLAATMAAPAATLTVSPGCFSAGVPRRLTRAQVVNALSDITKELTGDATLAASVAPLVTEATQFPPDTLLNPDSARHKGFERLDVAVNVRQVSSLHATAEALARSITADPNRVNAMLGSCSGTADACITSFIRRSGRLIMRQPLSDAEVNVYRAAAGNTNTPTAVAKVMATMIASPKFYFVTETGQAPAAGVACTPLTAHEQATRLALHLWDSVPDAALNTAADDGSLLQSPVYAAQVTRLLADPRADRAMRKFFAQWLRLDELVAMDGKVGNARFDAFAGSFKPLAGTRDAAIADVLDMVSYVAARNGSLQQVLTDRHSFARSADIAALYNTPVWDGSANPATFNESSRAGLLTRIGMLANGSSETTLPIQRGIRVLSALTCQSMPPPAMDQSNAKADLAGVLTTRQRTERITQMDGTSCINCHRSLINPWGFVFEGFDALGRVRSTEVVRDEAGKSIGEKPVDTAAVATLSGIAARAIATPAEAQQYVLDSGHFERCFAKNYVRYAFGRNDTPTDAPLIESLRQKAASGANLRSLFAFIALRGEFNSIQKSTP